MKIAVFSEANSFLGPILKEMRKKHEVCMLKADANISIERVGKLMAWCDIAYFEWCDKLLDIATKIRPDRFIVARLHRYELHNKYFNTINWEAVNLLIFNIASKHIEKKFRERAPAMPEKIITTPDGVDIDFFKFHEREFKKPYQMCIIGTIYERKGIYDLIRMFAELEPGLFELNIVGKANAEYLDSCIELVEALGIKNSVRFWAHMPKNALVEFMKKQHIIISNSRDEGQHTVIKEGMATGLYPIINNWLGAKETYPEKYIFTKVIPYLQICAG